MFIYLNSYQIPGLSTTCPGPYKKWLRNLFSKQTLEFHNLAVEILYNYNTSICVARGSRGIISTSHSCKVENLDLLQAEAVAFKEAVILTSNLGLSHFCF